MKLVTLIENTAAEAHLAAEHGLSLYLETKEHKILFDFGQTDAFAANAETLGIDLTQVDIAILSHGHYDHGGGLGKFLELNQKAPVYLSRHAFENHLNARGKDIGLNPALSRHPRLCFVDGETQIAPGLTLCTLDRPPKLPSGHQVVENGVSQPEDYRHELYLRIQEGEKTILVSGCSHKGILSIAQAFQPDLLIGGFHFVNIAEEAWLSSAAQILLAQPTAYYTGHCTGQAQFDFLKNQMGQRLGAIHSGTILQFP